MALQLRVFSEVLMHHGSYREGRVSEAPRRESGDGGGGERGARYLVRSGGGFGHYPPSTSSPSTSPVCPPLYLRVLPRGTRSAAAAARLVVVGQV